MPQDFKKIIGPRRRAAVCAGATAAEMGTQFSEGYRGGLSPAVGRPHTIQSRAVPGLPPNPHPTPPVRIRVCGPLPMQVSSVGRHERRRPV